MSATQHASDADLLAARTARQIRDAATIARVRIDGKPHREQDGGLTITLTMAGRVLGTIRLGVERLSVRDGQAELQAVRCRVEPADRLCMTHDTYLTLHTRASASGPGAR